MFVLRIEHPVPDFDTWKKEGFDSDPLGREQGGVRSHRILQAIEDPNYVMIDLEFDSSSEAKTFLAALRGMWDRVQDRFEWTKSPVARIFEVVESKEYRK